MPGATAPDPAGFGKLVDIAVQQAFLDTYWVNRVRDNVLLNAIKEEGELEFTRTLGKFAEWNARVARYDAEYRARGDVRDWEARQLRVAYATAYSRIESRTVFYEEDVEDLDDELAKSWYKRELTDLSDDFMFSLNNRLLARHTQSSNAIFGVAQDTTLASGDPGLLGLLDIFDYGGSAASAYQYDADAKTVSANAMSSTILEMAPNGTFCGVSTHPTADLSGVDGTREPESTSPVIINADSTDSQVATSSTTIGWATNADVILDYAIPRCRRSTGAGAKRPTLGIARPKEITALKKAIGSTIDNQVLLTEKEHNKTNAGYFHREFVPYGPTVWHEDSDCPDGVRFLLHPKTMRFWVKKQKRLGNGKQTIKGNPSSWFRCEQDYDMDLGGVKALAAMRGQLCPNPFRQCAIVDFDVIG